MILCSLLILSGLLTADNSTILIDPGSMDSRTLDNDSNLYHPPNVADRTDDLIISTRSTRDDADEEPNNNMDTATLLNLKFGLGNFTMIIGELSPTDTVDWYKFYASKGWANGEYAEKFNFVLNENNTANGVFMELYAHYYS